VLLGVISTRKQHEHDSCTLEHALPVSSDVAVTTQIVNVHFKLSQQIMRSGHQNKRHNPALKSAFFRPFAQVVEVGWAEQ